MSLKNTIVGLGLFLLLFLVLGARTAPAGDKEDIVGRWDNPISDAAYIRFNADGTFKEVALLGTQTGTYRILGDGVIEFETPGIFYGTNKNEVKYKLNGDTLELKIVGEYVKYTRAR
jgi:hypothetical protein